MKQTQALTLAGLFSVLLSLFALGGCKGDTPTPDPKDDLSFTVRLPDPIQVDGVRGSLAYYWDKDFVLSYQLAQGGTTITGEIKPKFVLSDGTAAEFQISNIGEKGFRKDEKFELKGTISAVNGKELAPVTLVSSDKIGRTLPFDLLNHVPESFALGGSFDYKSGSESPSFRAKAKGRVVLFQIETDATITPVLLKFKSEKTGALSVAFPGDESLSPEFSPSYLLWMPATGVDLGKVSAGITFKKGDEKLTLEAPAYPVLTDVKTPLVLSIDKGKLALSDKPTKPEAADDSEGGDPFFTMNDIDFWVGNGSKRAALVIEFHFKEGEDAYVWGYRFDGDKTGYEMFNDIVHADPRLSALDSPSGMGGYQVLGCIAYQSGETVSVPKPPFLIDGKEVPNDGKGLTTVPTSKDFDRYIFKDPKALFRAGFYTNGYWVYYTKDNRLDSWVYSNIVYKIRHLADGAWDGWSFQIGMDSFTGNPLGGKFRSAPAPQK